MAKPMVKIHADLSGIAGYSGAVGGILEAVQSPSFQGDFVEHTLKNIRSHFMAESIAAALAGDRRIQHVFEWPEQDDDGVSTRQPSGIPLFKLNIVGKRQFKALTFKFLPSVRQVPLPDPAATGFNPDKLQHLKRHIFRWKALVMESSAQVTIKPKGDNKLFVPTSKNKYGYVLTGNPQKINPGGAQATGGFTEWWNVWFEVEAPQRIKEQTKLAEEVIKASGQKAIRDATTGRFARGQTVTMGYINSQKRVAAMKVKLAGKNAFESHGEVDE